MATELVTNGTFDTDTTGWSATSAATLSIESQRLRITNSEAGNGGAEQLSISGFEAGKTYRVTADCFAGTSGGWTFKAGTGIFQVNETDTSDGSVDQTWVATTTTGAVQLLTGSATLNEYSEFDNISIMEQAAATEGAGAIRDGRFRQHPLYPRKIMLDGMLVFVQTPGDMRALLAKRQRELEAERRKAQDLGIPGDVDRLSREIARTRIRIREAPREGDRLNLPRIIVTPPGVRIRRR